MEGKAGLEPEMEMGTGKQEQGREEGEKRGSKGEIRNRGSSPDSFMSTPHFIFSSLFHCPDSNSQIV